MDFVALHLLALLITLPAVTHADHMGFKYMRGTTPTLPEASVKWTHRLVFSGLFLLIITGVIITVPSWEVWFSKPLFYVKLAFVLTLLVNGLFIQKLMHTATQKPWSALAQEERRTLTVSGALSGAGWIATILIGLFLL